MTPEQKRIKIVFTPERARAILYGGDPNYSVIKNEIVDTSRWSIHHELVIQNKENLKFFKGYYSVGATESQDESPWEYTEPEFNEVEPVETTTIVYK